MPTLRPLLLLLLAALSGPVAAQGERVLRVCMTDTPHEPWRYTVDGRVPKGLDHELLNRFGQRSGWRVALQTVSGRRCLIELQQGRADATVGLSHNAERAAYVRYPMRGGRPDPALALRMDGYSLYHRPGFALQWDGQSLRLPPGSVVEVLSGQSVIGDLKRRGVEFVERGREAEHSLQRLVDGQAQIAALPTSRVEALRQRVPAYAALVQAEPALSVKPYFAVFAEGFAQAHEAELPALWRAFDEASRFPAYQQAARRSAATTR
jgi:polar amino acid transport system substrate-binding protein